MGFITRLQNAFRGFTQPPQPRQGYTSDRRPSTSLDVMRTKMAFESFSQPVWGPEIATLGAYAREGYTSKTFDIPFIPFKTQEIALQTDEDVQFNINDLASKISGASHYWKATDDQTAEYMHKFTKDLMFDVMDTEMLKELLWYGNTFYKPRLGIKYIRNNDDLMHLPISSAIRIWWDRQRIPYKYEFRGPEYQGYHNPSDIIHLKWNPINASAFGTGFGVAMTTPHSFQQITPAGPQDAQLPSILDIKYSTLLTMHISERRYTPHNVYKMPQSSPEERAQARADLAAMKPGEDFVVGTDTEVQELGSVQRAFNPTQWQELSLARIFKALNDFRGKNASEAGHQYANAKTAALLDEIGLSSFPVAVISQLIVKLFKPWYEYNPLYSMSYGGGLVSMPWDECKYEFNFGQVEKKNLTPEQTVALLNIGISSGAIPDPVEIRDILEDSGIALRKEFTNDIWNTYHNTRQYPPNFQGNNFSTVGADLQKRPMDNPNYTDHDNPTPRFPPPFDPQPSDPRLNFTKKNTKISQKPFLD